jgi:hypothetical protein
VALRAHFAGAKEAFRPADAVIRKDLRE